MEILRKDPDALCRRAVGQMPGPHQPLPAAGQAQQLVELLLRRPAIAQKLPLPAVPVQEQGLIPVLSHRAGGPHLRAVIPQHPESSVLCRKPLRQSVAVHVHIGYRRAVRPGHPQPQQHSIPRMVRQVLRHGKGSGLQLVIPGLHVIPVIAGILAHVHQNIPAHRHHGCLHPIPAVIPALQHGEAVPQGIRPAVQQPPVIRQLPHSGLHGSGEADGRHAVVSADAEQQTIQLQHPLRLQRHRPQPQHLENFPVSLVILQQIQLIIQPQQLTAVLQLEQPPLLVPADVRAKPLRKPAVPFLQADALTALDGILTVLLWVQCGGQLPVGVLLIPGPVFHGFIPELQQLRRQGRRAGQLRRLIHALRRQIRPVLRECQSPPDDAQSRRAAFRGTQGDLPVPGVYQPALLAAPPGPGAPDAAHGAGSIPLRPHQVHICHAALPRRRGPGKVISLYHIRPVGALLRHHPVHSGQPHPQGQLRPCRNHLHAPGILQDGLQQLLAVHTVKLPPVQQHQRIPAVAAVQKLPLSGLPPHLQAEGLPPLVKDIVCVVLQQREVLLRQPVDLLRQPGGQPRHSGRCPGRVPFPQIRHVQPPSRHPAGPPIGGPVPGVGQQADRRRSAHHHSSRRHPHGRLFIPQSPADAPLDADLAEGHRTRRHRPPGSGAIQKRLGIRPLVRLLQVPQHRLVTGVFHIPAQQDIRRPQQGVEPVHRQQQKRQGLHPVVPVPDVGPLMGQHIVPASPVQAEGQVDAGPDKPQHKGRRGLFAFPHAVLQPHRRPQPHPQPHIAACQIQRHGRHAHKPHHRGDVAQALPRPGRRLRCRRTGGTADGGKPAGYRCSRRRQHVSGDRLRGGHQADAGPGQQVPRPQQPHRHNGPQAIVRRPGRFFQHHPQHHHQQHQPPGGNRPVQNGQKKLFHGQFSFPLSSISCCSCRTSFSESRRPRAKAATKAGREPSKVLSTSWSIWLCCTCSFVTRLVTTAFSFFTTPRWLSRRITV